MPIINKIKNRLANDSDSDDEDNPQQDIDVDAPGPQANNRNSISTSPIEWTPSYGYCEEKDAYFRSYYFSSWPSTVSEHMFWSILTDTQLEYDIALHLERKDPLKAIGMLNDLSDRLEDKATGALSMFTLNPESVQRTAKVISAMKQSMEQNNENLFSVSGHITIYSDSLEELRKDHRTIEDKMQLKTGVKIKTTTYEQDIGLRASSPLGFNEYYDRHGDDVSQLMTGNVASAMFPYVSDTIFEPGGVDIGINLASMTPTIVNPFNRPAGYHMLRLGRTGSGKTFGASQFFLRLAIKMPDVYLTIIDPMGDFTGVNHALGGTRITIDGNEHLNPLEITPTPQHVLERSEGKMNPYKMKIKDVEWFLDRYFALNDITPDEKQRAVRSMAIQQAYADAGITEDPATHRRDSPTMTDVREILTDMNINPEDYAEPATDDLIEKIRDAAGDLVLALEPFKEGGRYSNLAKPTNIDFGTNRFTYIDMSAINARDDSLGLMMQLLFGLVYRESKQVDAPYVMAIDEAHKVLRNSDSAGFLAEVFRHGRHFDLSVQLLSQTFEEFFVTESAKTIARQCTMVQLHQMDRIDEDLARDAMGLNETQIRRIKDLQPGDGDKNYSEALLDISDHGMIPLRVKATKDEVAVIDYDPAESWRNLPEPRSMKIKQALDQRNKHDTPVVNLSENELADETLREVLSKQRNVQETLLQNGVNPAEFIPEDDLEKLAYQYKQKKAEGSEESDEADEEDDEESENYETPEPPSRNKLPTAASIEAHSVANGKMEDTEQAAEEGVEVEHDENSGDPIKESVEGDSREAEEKEAEDKPDESTEEVIEKTTESQTDGATNEESSKGEANEDVDDHGKGEEDSTDSEQTSRDPGQFNWGDHSNDKADEAKTDGGEVSEE